MGFDGDGDGDGDGILGNYVSRWLVSEIFVKKKLSVGLSCILYLFSFFQKKNWVERDGGIVLIIS